MGVDSEESHVVAVLVVDDDALAARQLCEMLAPHEADVAPHPDAALKALDRRPFDVILVDVYFAGMPSGFRLVSMLQTRRPRPIVVMITAADSNALEDEALVSKAWLTRDALHELIDRLLAAPRRNTGNGPPLTARRDRLRPFIANVRAAAQHTQLTIADHRRGPVEGGIRETRAS